MRKTAKIAALLAIVLCGCSIRPPAAKAQFIGYTGPQTVQTSLATNLNCTGTAQNFTTGITPGFNNLGQTQHFVSVAASSSTTSLQMVIQGIDNSGNVFAISDIGQINGTITASGYFPNVRVVVTCAPITATFSLNYSGASSTPIVNSGSYLSSLIDKLIFRSFSATGNITSGVISTPFGSSSGKILFQFSNVQAGSAPVIQLQCQGTVTTGNYDTFGYVLSSAGNIQQYTVPTSECPAFVIAFAAAGTPAGTFSLEYVFDTPGLAPSQSQTTSCVLPNSNGILTNTVPITVGANTTVRLVVAGVSNRIGICSLLLTVGVAGTAQLIEGTGATCGTGTTNLSGAMTLAVGTPLSLSGIAPNFATNIQGDSVCLTTAGGATAAGMLSFIVLPI